jgi:hypothetical protein|tara:strand:+ start:368 stop:607 length:240 start_codon:yes stop_codon:yes gene_type:complete
MKNGHSTTNLDKLSSRIAAVSQDEILIAVLKDEIEIHKSRLEPHDTGHLHTAIGVIQRRIDELQNTHYTHEQEISIENS